MWRPFGLSYFGLLSGDLIALAFGWLKASDVPVVMICQSFSILAVALSVWVHRR